MDQFKFYDTLMNRRINIVCGFTVKVYLLLHISKSSAFCEILFWFLYLSVILHIALSHSTVIVWVGDWGSEIECFACLCKENIWEVGVGMNDLTAVTLTVIPPFWNWQLCYLYSHGKRKADNSLIAMRASVLAFRQ